MSVRSDRMAAVRAFGERCGHEVGHAEQVARLAAVLFEALSQRLGLAPEALALLEAAALLHDVGYQVSYEKHHKHSFRLISEAALPGFGERERALVAAVARYHTGALPRDSHRAMRDLGLDDRAIVSRLSALLRVADGLDRTHGARVESVKVESRGDTVSLQVSGHPPLESEIHCAARKADLLRQVLGTAVVVTEGGYFGS